MAMAFFRQGPENEAITRFPSCINPSQRFDDTGWRGIVLHPLIRFPGAFGSGIGRLFSIHALLLALAFPARVQTQTFPTLNSSNPSLGAVGFPVHGVVEYSFSEEMRPQQQLTWLVTTVSPNTRLSEVSVEWSYDRRTLRAWRKQGFSAGERIAWGLDERGFAAVGSGLPLDLDKDGDFVVGSAGVAAENPRLSVMFSRSWTQSGTNELFSSVPAGFAFRAEADFGHGTDYTGSVLVRPTSEHTRLVQSAGSGPAYSLRWTGVDSQEFENQFPNGDYRFEVYAPTSTQFVFASVTNRPFPDPLHVSDLPGAGFSGSNATFRIVWDKPGESADAAVIRICDALSGTEVYASPPPGDAGGIAASAGSADLPISVLAAGHGYKLFLERWRMDVQPLSGFTTAVGFGAVSEMAFAGSFLSPGRISWIERSNQAILLEVSGSRGNPPVLERTLDWKAWSSLGVGSWSNGVLRFEDPVTTNPAAFYRVRAP